MAAGPAPTDRIAHPEDSLGVGDRYDEIASYTAAAHRLRAAAAADAAGWLAGLFVAPIRQRRRSRPPLRLPAGRPA